ncbi:MAG: M48 family metalloprotease [Hyphomicrobiaceae bacterium]
MTSIKASKRTPIHVMLLAAALALSALLANPTPVQAQGIPLIRDTETEQLLQDYADPIFRAAGFEKGRIKVRIVRSRIFNAFVIDGLNVYVHTGAIQESETPNQLIGVIAHEAGHIDGGHMAALRTRIQRDQTRLLLMRILGIGAAIATGSAAAAVAGDELVLRSLLAERRAQEGAADLAGMKFLNATRQSGRGMLETFERFARQEFVSESSQDPFVRSHPVAAQRLGTLRQLVETSPHFERRDPPELQLRHDLVRAKISGYLDSPAATFGRYPRSDTSLPAQYGRAIAAFFAGGGRGYESAAPLIDELVRQQPNNAYFHELRAELLSRTGRAREAIPHYRRALSLAGNQPLMQIRLASAQLLGQPGSEAEVIALLERVVSRDREPEAYRTLAEAYYKVGRRPEADAVTALARLENGDVAAAKSFAQRAKAALPAGSPYIRRMNDVLFFAEQN